MCVEIFNTIEFFFPDCIVLTVELRGCSLIVWGTISRNGLQLLDTLHEKFIAAHYVDILGDQMHSVVQTLFTEGCPLYQDEKAPIHTAKIIQNCFEEHEEEVGQDILLCFSHSSDQNIIWEDICQNSILEFLRQRRFWN